MNEIRQLLTDVLRDVDDHDQAPGYDEMADALLASPELAAIIDIAAHWIAPVDDPMPKLKQPVIKLLKNWRVNR